jgi:hypothetical protein
LARGSVAAPLAARGAFVAVCGAIIGVTVLDGSWSITGARGLNEFGLASTSWTHLVFAALASTVEPRARCYTQPCSKTARGGIIEASGMIATVMTC